MCIVWQDGVCFFIHLKYNSSAGGEKPLGLEPSEEAISASSCEGEKLTFKGTV